MMEEETVGGEEEPQKVPRLEEEEFLTEEDLQSAEEEFLNDRLPEPRNLIFRTVRKRIFLESF